MDNVIIFPRWVERDGPWAVCQWATSIGLVIVQSGKTQRLKLVEDKK